MRLTAEVGLALLVDEEDLAAGVGQLRGRDESGEAVAHDDGISIHDLTLNRITDQ